MRSSGGSVVDVDAPRLIDSGLRAYAVLHSTVADLIERDGLAADVDTSVALCWATMQGLVVLQPKLDAIDALAGRPATSTRDRVRRLTALMLDGVRHAGPL